jgi:hypothetical protein
MVPRGRRQSSCGEPEVLTGEEGSRVGEDLQARQAHGLTVGCFSQSTRRPILIFSWIVSGAFAKPQTQMKKAFLIVASLAFVSCASVTETEAFYRPTTLKSFTPKPKNHVIPILGAFPREPHDVIGVMAFTNGRGGDFTNKALQHNARKAGADAVVILRTGSETTQVPYTVPGYTTYQPVVTNSTYRANAYGSGGYASATGYGTSTTNVPVYTPGFSGVRNVTMESVEACMIRLRQ